ncbi:hypothetical protein C1E23_20505 [Pseudoalteromonas phenolica]|uniref:Uncharacterized protein n=1 Tax=Pseudoalteromonas phenolica TaxID=161398 RepID=A0A4Q7IGT6_9GAMM|nr:hypothetical protein [Pseudoalteromonas phenolica]RZQ51253.1 hypothetical protein C1E23_20505 [Pseudoalteromonas phenolica]
MQAYKGKSRLVIGFGVGFMLTLLILTFSSESGFYSLTELLKYSSYGGLFVGFICFVYYELGYDAKQTKDNKNVTSHNSYSDSNIYSNHTESSGSESGGGGD